MDCTALLESNKASGLVLGSRDRAPDTWECPVVVVDPWAASELLLGEMEASGMTGPALGQRQHPDCLTSAPA